VRVDEGCEGWLVVCEISTQHIDVDECELTMDNCHVNSTCADVIGSYICTCNNGFDGDGVNCTSKKFV